MNESMDLDWVCIHELRVQTRIGVYEWEQRIDQTLLIDITCLVNLTVPVVELSQTVDYEAMSMQVTTLVSGQSFQLIETVAQQVATLVLEQFQVKRVKVTVSKPQAVQNAQRVSVSIERLKP